MFSHPAPPLSPLSLLLTHLLWFPLVFMLQNIFQFNFSFCFSYFFLSFPLHIFLPSAFFLSFGIFTSLYLQFYFITHSSSYSSSCSSRSRLSWGQMLGCYAHSGLTVCGLELGERSSGLQSSWLPQCLAPKAPRRHLYPVAFLLVTSHLLVLWLILSLVILLAKYQ